MRRKLNGDIYFDAQICWVERLISVSVHAFAINEDFLSGDGTLRAGNNIECNRLGGKHQDFSRGRIAQRLCRMRACNAVVSRFLQHQSERVVRVPSTRRWLRRNYDG